MSIARWFRFCESVRQVLEAFESLADGAATLFVGSRGGMLRTRVFATGADMLPPHAMKPRRRNGAVSGTCK